MEKGLAHRSFGTLLSTGESRKFHNVFLFAFLNFINLSLSIVAGMRTMGNSDLLSKNLKRDRWDGLLN